MSGPCARSISTALSRPLSIILIKPSCALEPKICSIVWRYSIRASLSLGAAGRIY
jgi:hypothetical protein